MIVRFLAGFILAMTLSTLAIAAAKKAVWTDHPAGVVYKMQKSDALKPATRYEPLTAAEIKALVPAPTREEIEAKAVTFGMSYPILITQAFIEAEASKLGMVYPSTATEPDLTLLQRVMVNGSMPCIVLKADMVKPIGGKYYTANISLWNVDKPLEVGVGCY